MAGIFSARWVRAVLFAKQAVRCNPAQPVVTVTQMAVSPGWWQRCEVAPWRTERPPGSMLCCASKMGILQRFITKQILIPRLFQSSSLSNKKVKEKILTMELKLGQQGSNFYMAQKQHLYPCTSCEQSV